MSKNSLVEKLPLEIQQWITQSLVDGTYENYDTLRDRLQQKGYDISRSALARFGKKLLGKYEMVKLAKACSPEEEKARQEAEEKARRQEEMRIRCLELAKGNIEVADTYLAWVLKTD